MTEDAANAAADLDETADSIDDVVTPLELGPAEANEVYHLGREARDNLGTTLKAVLRDLEEDPPVVKLASLAALDESLDDLKAFTSRFREVTGEMVDHPNGGDHE